MDNKNMSVSVSSHNSDIITNQRKSELKQSLTFGNGYCYAVTVDGFVIALCQSYFAATILAKEYRVRFERPCIEIVEAEMEIGKVYIG